MADSETTSAAAEPALGPAQARKELSETQRQNWLKCLEKRRQNIAKRAEEKLARASEERDLSQKKRKVLNEVSKKLDKRDLPSPEEIVVPDKKKPRELDPWQDREDKLVDRIVSSLKPLPPAAPPASPVSDEEEEEDEPKQPRTRRPYVRKKPYVPRSKRQECEPTAPTLQEAQVPQLPRPPMLRWI